MQRLLSMPEFQEFKEYFKKEIYENLNKEMNPQTCGFFAGIKAVIEHPEEIVKEFKGEI